MTREFLLAPFSPANQDRSPGPIANEVWTGVTQRYGVNISCEEPIQWLDGSEKRINSTWGCNYLLPVPRVIPNTDDSKMFDALYVGYENPSGDADYYLSDGSCPPSQNQTFLIQWSKALIPGSQFSNLSNPELFLEANVTTLWCRSSYYVQDVRAAVSANNKQVLNFTALGDPKPLPANLFNVTSFEAAMSTGSGNSTQRSDFPTQKWPSQASFLLDMPLNIAYLPEMTPFALGALQRPLDDYLNGTVLQESYQAAYRLLFARQMVDVISKSINTSAVSLGQRSYTTQAVVMVPAFAYVAEGFLGAIALLALSLLYLSWRRQCNLVSDPASVSATMAISGSCERLLNLFSKCDRLAAKELEDELGSRRFQLRADRDSNTPYSLVVEEDQYARRSRQDTAASMATNNVVRGIQPLEFNLKTGLCFFVIQVFLFAFIPALLWQVRKHNGKIAREAASPESGLILHFRPPLTDAKPVCSTAA
jgi:hypothetical protein